MGQLHSLVNNLLEKNANGCQGWLMNCCKQAPTAVPDASLKRALYSIREPTVKQKVKKNFLLLCNQENKTIYQLLNEIGNVMNYN